MVERARFVADAVVTLTRAPGHVVPQFACLIRDEVGLRAAILQKRRVLAATAPGDAERIEGDLGREAGRDSQDDGIAGFCEVRLGAGETCKIVAQTPAKGRLEAAGRDRPATIEPVSARPPQHDPADVVLQQRDPQFDTAIADREHSPDPVTSRVVAEY